MNTLLVEVRCGHRGGQCGRLLATVTEVPPPHLPDHPEALFLNAYGEERNPAGWDRREGAVPRDYGGGMRLPACKCYDGTWGRGSGKVSGEGYFPYTLLREAVACARRAGKRQVVLWVPWATDGVAPPWV